jgi:hypothetical protein
MGLAIPRPTRLGDPRAINRDLSIILSVGMIIFKPSYPLRKPDCTHLLMSQWIMVIPNLGWSAIAYSPIEPKSLEHQ